MGPQNPILIIKAPILQPDDLYKAEAPNPKNPKMLNPI